MVCLSNNLCNVVFVRLNTVLNQQQYPARITWRFLIRAGAAAPLSDFTASRKSSSNAGWIRSTPFDLAACCLGGRNASGKLLSKPLRGADRACCCWLSTFLQQPHEIF